MKQITMQDLTQDPAARSLSFFAQAPAVLAGPGLFAEMRERLAASEQSTLRVCLHTSPEDAHHDMLIVANAGHYIPPHHHPGKTETLHLLQGELAVLQYGADGSFRGGHRMRAGEILRISGSAYFFLVPLSEVLYHESKPGPWSPAGDMVVPAWAPDATDAAAVKAFTANALKRLAP